MIKSPLTLEAERAWEERNRKIIEERRRNQKRHRHIIRGDYKKPVDGVPDKAKYPMWPHPDSSRAQVAGILREAGEDGLLFHEVVDKLGRGKLVALQALVTLRREDQVKADGPRGRNRSKGQQTYRWHEHA